MAHQALKAQFFVIRQNDRMVPLIALDELPDHIVIRDVPRTLTPRDMQGMTCIGSYDTRHQKHTVVNMNQSPATPLGEKSLSSMVDKISAKDPLPNSASRLLKTPVVDAKLAGVGIQDTQTDLQTSSTDRFTTPEKAVRGFVSATQSPADAGNPLSDPFVSTPSPITSLPPPGVKTYCSYWLRTGNCDFAQQGCMYKHEMPTDLETLNRLGHRDIPAWFRQKFGVGSFLAVQGADASFNTPDLKSVIASGSRTPNSRFSNDWRSPPSRRNVSDSGSDGNTRSSGLRTAKGNRQSANSSPLNPSRPAVARRSGMFRNSDRVAKTDMMYEEEKPETIVAVNSQEHLEAGLRGKSALHLSRYSSDKEGLTQRAPASEGHEVGVSGSPSSKAVNPDSHRRISLVSVFSDIEAEIFREDTRRKAKEEEEERTSTESESPKEAVARPTGQTPKKEDSAGMIRDKAFSPRTGGSVSGAATRRRRGRGDGEKGASRENSGHDQKA